ncbi:cob(I)yrinic acid a,c-diamide adenosyltransferase [Paenibacillus sp. GCM10012307]|uniref:Corrinoid adenosyltransferase n=1 Tax=Paenibacillus roseus TaxID=2798579 RepID=A0A934J326_9BACL|nr:cob(I)yrinic acid a,c-diamide adenosyltransferase [Paenibacillus roseus]MBJ6363856.1 cob(I)yrinic acid a,c-diamide adenosyltransferase [Paenibacillus roseus]
MKLYTRTGDKGQTALIGGRVPKDHPRVEAYGTIDELNAFTGQALAVIEPLPELAEMAARLKVIMNELFDCGSDLSYDDEHQPEYKLTEEYAIRLEQWIDDYQQQAPEIRQFILPGGSAAAAALHVCRTVCRRAERAVVALTGRHTVNTEAVTYLNRLSDFYFAAARAANAKLGIPDVSYIPGLRADGLSR